jgi:hypothetical protein
MLLDPTHEQHEELQDWLARITAGVFSNFTRLGTSLVNKYGQASPDRR